MALKSITKKKTNKTVKRELLNSLQDNDDVEVQGLNETANNVNNYQEAILIICRCEDIIKTQNKKAVGYMGTQGQLLKKLKHTEHFFGNVGQSKSTIYFQISLYKFSKKYCLIKKTHYKQFISKIILRVSRLFPKKTQKPNLFCIGN